jgi:hypothetical protein
VSVQLNSSVRYRKQRFKIKNSYAALLLSGRESNRISIYKFERKLILFREAIDSDNSSDAYVKKEFGISMSQVGFISFLNFRSEIILMAGIQTSLRVNESDRSWYGLGFLRISVL